MNSLEKVMGKKGTPTLKAIAAVFDLPAVRLYSVAKQPKEGEVYDAKVYNWDAIERFITRRFDADLGLDSLEAIIEKALEIDVELKDRDGRRGGGGVEKFELDGKLIPKRKHAHFEIDAAAQIVLKGDENVWVVVYQTASHSVMVPVTEKGEAASQNVKVISNGMLNMKGFGPVLTVEAIKERFANAKEAAKAEKASE